ncbi:Hypothetical protein NTJ_10493 [Nesidiocoris tenuis]|uniref:Uncharacterized protein n=1 Tax=Nesidiocoris tenuis TaxID=355587 RepID=A0ABN7B272_9HEMI|nr:Hypothetical protein NTJ_10493 [Nesidiocoris tenuis]
MKSSVNQKIRDERWLWKNTPFSVEKKMRARKCRHGLEAGRSLVEVTTEPSEEIMANEGEVKSGENMIIPRGWREMKLTITS